MTRFGNRQKMIELAEPSYSAAKEVGLIDIAARYIGAPRLAAGDHEFINMCSCSYLGLDSDPRILDGAIEGVREAGSLHLTTARMRIFTELLGETEAELSEHFRCEATVFNSCGAASSSFLPVLASGAATSGVKPVMVFDKFAHLSMQHIKPICGDETEVYTCQNNDVEFIEGLCKKHPLVAYVSDGTYSISGQAPVRELKSLQDRYGLFLFLDDSHGLSITGQLGEGHVRQYFPELNERTVVVASLAKAFGACGGVLMSGTPRHDLLVRYGTSWSQYLNSAGLGAIKASLKIHQSEELAALQEKWWSNAQFLDQQYVSPNSGLKSPIRVISLRSAARAIEIAREVYRRGFYTSAVFFPTVPKGTAGLRVMPRADVGMADMKEFATVLRDVCGDDLVAKEM